MDRKRLLLATLLFVLAHMAALPICAQVSCGATDVECAQAAAVGLDVKNALVAANGTGLSGLVLQKAVLTLETASTGTAGLNINFLVFTFKHQTKKNGTVTQVITWGSVGKAEGTAGSEEDLQNILAKAIALSAKIAAGVKTLPLSEATITIKFVVDKDTSGSLSYKIFGVNLDPSVDVDKVSTNTLVVTFALPNGGH